MHESCWHALVQVSLGSDERRSLATSCEDHSSYLDVGESWDVSLSLLGDDEVEGRDILCNNTTTDRLSLSLTSTSWTVARVSLGEEETNTVREQDTYKRGLAQCL